MGEVERIRASLGASFNGYGQRVNGAPDRNPKKHHQEERPHHEDALELHVEEGEEPVEIHPATMPTDSEDHLDLSA